MLDLTIYVCVDSILLYHMIKFWPFSLWFVKIESDLQLILIWLIDMLSEFDLFFPVNSRWQALITVSTLSTPPRLLLSPPIPVFSLPLFRYYSCVHNRYLVLVHDFTVCLLSDQMRKISWNFKLSWFDSKICLQAFFFVWLCVCSVMSYA